MDLQITQLRDKRRITFLSYFIFLSRQNSPEKTFPNIRFGN